MGGLSKTLSKLTEPRLSTGVLRCPPNGNLRLTPIPFNHSMGVCNCLGHIQSTSSTTDSTTSLGDIGQWYVLKGTENVCNPSSLGWSIITGMSPLYTAHRNPVEVLHHFLQQCTPAVQLNAQAGSSHLCVPPSIGASAAVAVNSPSVD